MLPNLWPLERRQFGGGRTLWTELFLSKFFDNPGDLRLLRVLNVALQHVVSQREARFQFNVNYFIPCPVIFLGRR